jgi:hypothetical protein
MAHVLIGSAEAVSAPEVIFSLWGAGHRVSVFGSETGRRMLLGLPVHQFLTVPDPSVDAHGAVRALETQTDGAQAPDAILPLDDASLWLVAQSPRLLALTAGADRDGINLALDKAQQINAARAAGLSVPPTRVIDRRADLQDAGITLPAILKPQMAVRIEDGHLTRGKAKYLMNKQDMENQPDDLGDTFLLQPLIKGVGEGIFGFAGPHGITAWTAHRRVRMMNPHGSGSSACRSIPPDPDLRDAVERFITAVHWRGPFMVEFLRDAEDTPWFMELNGRMWGSLALARRQGVEYPALAVALQLDPTHDPGGVTARSWPHVQRHLGRDLVHLLMVLRGPKTAHHRAGWPRLGQALREVLRPAPRASFYNHDPAYPRFFLADAMRTVARTLFR